MGNAFSIGVINSYAFYLDTSLQKKLVYLGTPTIQDWDDHEGASRHVHCTNTKGRFPTISGVESSTYLCTQDNTFGLKKGQSFYLPITVQVGTQDLSAFIVPLEYRYDPYGAEQNGANFRVLLYLDQQNKICSRLISFSR